MCYEHINSDLGYLDWSVRESCMTGDDETNQKIWKAYELVKLSTNEKTDDLFPVAPITGGYVLRAICCNRLTEKPELTAVVLLAEMMADMPGLWSFDFIEEQFGELIRHQVEDMVAIIDTENLTTYNKLLSCGSKWFEDDDLLTIELIRLLCDCLDFAESYRNWSEKNWLGCEFVRMGGLPLLVLDENPYSACLQEAYDKTSILMGYAEQEWRFMLTMARGEIVESCQLVYDCVIWNDSRP